MNKIRKSRMRVLTSISEVHKSPPTLPLGKRRLDVVPKARKGSWGERRPPTSKGRVQFKRRNRRNLPPL